jgi:hypothetical protein
MRDLDFDEMLSMLKAKKNFSFSRFGDGEWAAVFGDEGGNCDNHPYYKELGLALAAVLLRPQLGYMGLQPKAINDLGGRISEWVKANGGMIEWCNADLIHDASIADRLHELLGAMRGRKKILIGPAHLYDFAFRNQMIFIATPSDFPVWKAWTTIYADLVEQLDKDATVLYCASMATEVMIDKASREYGDTITQIDIGSAFDPAAGVVSRRYHKSIIEREEQS